MKKTLVALAALASVSAFAQSSVTIYGIIDQGYAVTTTKLSAPDGAGSLKYKQSATGLQHGLATQRIGFKGEEDLGGGTKALFQIENAINANDASTSGFGSRPTFVGLTNASAGTLTLGRQDTPMLKAAGGQLAGGTTALIGGIVWNGFAPTTIIAAGDVPAAALGRALGGVTTNNAVNYKTPTYNGFDAELQVARDTQKLNADAVDVGTAGATSRNDQTGYNLKYANGPMTLAYAHQTAKTSVDATASVANYTGGTLALTRAAESKTSSNYYGATYDLGGKVLSLNHADTRNTTPTGEAWKISGNQVGIKAPVAGNFSAVATYSKGKRSVGDETKFKQNGYQLVGLYAFSKRTTGYGGYGSQKLKGDDIGTTGMSLKQNQYVVGINHTF